MKYKYVRRVWLLIVVCIFRVYEDDCDNEDDREGGFGEEWVFWCKLIVDEFKKWCKVEIIIIINVV